ncbi:MAG: hypothetical protein U1E76_26310 [Planctomycetota bacterium]
MKTGLIAGALVIAMVCGLLVSWYLLVPHQDGAEVRAPDDRAVRELLEVTRQIASELHQLRAAIAASSAPAREVSEPGNAPPAPDGDRLTAAIERLVVALGARPFPGAAAHTPPSAAAYPPHPDRLAAARQLAIEDRAHAHFFWTYERMLEQYGPPERMNASDGQLVWIYRDPGTQREMGFVFFDGFVVDAWG